MTVPTPSPQILWDSWQRGHLLYDAPEFFIPRKFLERFRTESDAETSTAFQKASQEASTGIVQTLLEGFKAQQAIIANNNYRIKIEDVLLKGLRTEQLFGLGFVVPRDLEDIPKPVPSDLWGGEINWHKGIVVAQELRMESVRVVNREILLPPPSQNDASQGRPSRSEDTIRAFEELWEMGKISLKPPMRKNYPIIRQYVMERYPNKDNDDTGLSDNVMQGLINPLIKKKILQNSKP